MEVIYKKIRYKLSFFQCLSIEYYKVVLLSRRSWRRFKFITTIFKDYILILVCVIMYFLIITSLGFFNKNYSNIYDSFWDNKEVIFTSVILPYFTAIYFETRNRKKTLQIQYSEYYRFKYYVNQLIHIFSKNIKNYKSIISNIYIDSDLENNIDVISLKNAIEMLSFTLENMIESSNDGLYSCNLTPIFMDTKKTLEKFFHIKDYNSKLLLNHINQFEMKCNVVFMNISWMWLQDNDIHKKIQKIISK